jgi:hypothetical protein
MSSCNHECNMRDPIQSIISSGSDIVVVALITACWRSDSSSSRGHEESQETYEGSVMLYAVLNLMIADNKFQVPNNLEVRAVTIISSSIIARFGSSSDSLSLKLQKLTYPAQACCRRSP